MDKINNTEIDDTHEMESYFQGKLEKDVLKDYKTNVNIEVKDSNCKVNLREFFMDDDSVYISVRFYNISQEDIASSAFFSIKFNSKEIFIGRNSAGIHYQYNDDSVDMLFTCDIDKLELSEIRDISLHFSKITYLDCEENCYDVSGTWKFSFKFNGAKVARKITYLNVNEFTNSGEENINIHYIKVTPMKVTVKTKHTGYNEDDSIGIGILDNTGELVTLYDAHGESYRDALSQTINFILDTRLMDKINIVPFKYIKDDKYEVFRDKAVTINIE